MLYCYAWYFIREDHRLFEIISPKVYDESMAQLLPIYDVIPRLKDLLNHNNRLVLQAPPGAGKTSCIPLELCREQWLAEKKIIMLEPRRIAARNAAWWMAKSLGEKVGESVGYTVHLDKKVSHSTVVEVVTEGVFINRLINDPELIDTGLVIFDEFHERNLDGDLALALVKESQDVLRNDLKVLIMSATLDGGPVAAFLDNAPLLSSEGRSYPVDVKYSGPPDNKGLISSVTSLIVKAIHEERGDILVFLPGAGEIKRVELSLNNRLPADTIVTPLYGALSRDEQERAIEPSRPGQRKVVLSTSIAESSITIKGVRVVIDSGLIRKPRFNPKTAMDSLETLDLSKASADQRTGRAGRVEPGVCYRLWDSFKKLDEYTEPAILCEDLSSMALTLARWGYRDIDQLQWLTSPHRAAYDQSMALLEELGAVNKIQGISERGVVLSKLPLHPRLGSVVLKGEDLKLKSLACDIASLLSERDILNFSREDYQSDLNYRLEALRGKNIMGAKTHYQSMKRVKELSKSLCSGKRLSDQTISGSLLIAAYPDRIAKALGDGLFQLVNGSEAVLSEVDTLYHEKFIIIPSLGGTGKNPKVFLAMGINESEILESCRNSLNTVEKLDFDKNKKRFRARRQVKLGHLTLKEESVPSIAVEDFHNALYNFFTDRGLGDLNWTKEAVNFRDRVNFLHSQDAHFPSFTDQALCRDFNWLSPYLGGLNIKNPISDIPLLEALKGFFPWSGLKDVEERTPTHFTVPSGSNISIDYSGKEPVLKVRIQELFGLSETPSVNKGSYPVTIHLLSPASRPIQITKDLNSFWNNTYREVKKDLMGRYPKHYWPDDPYQAQATNRVKKRM